ncbi:protein FAM83G [Electrophorus electricus]|uniref:Scaffolding anchor of CK1 domain-containing protein n=1 Tax=Electrophorus electricus TaxID=8005 RepID=A0A4W4GNJ5_ELEEL|nr:protein FAM83G [Electrophorus electricus]
MALSQIQCLDDNHVNWRMNESKPEFFYSEDQRLALEALITGGRDAFDIYVKEHEVRPFLSEPELERLSRSVEDYKPGSESHKTDGITEGEDGTMSLQYWPDRSDISIPDLDLGWPDINAFRGVTRVNVYMQPPVDGQTHIKEVVRKTIAHAQKVIAVVMDVFTDVDIFKDMLDAGFKRKVGVYIIIEQSTVQHFLNMCERAGMHKGHLKHLRVRCTGGSEFHTHTAKKVRGSLGQKFIFVDGDRAVSGSYSFTWTASRLDRNLITVLTGQVVESFDKQFRELYLNSRSVNLSKLPMAEPPEPDPPPVSVPVSVPSAAVARKLINPKYALVETASRTSSDQASPKNSNSQYPLPQPVKREVAENPPIHPGLVGLQKAELIAYLPTWPEPDPPSDVIGFINIRDTSKPMQAHLMRSQLFETSQPIRFREPFTPPPEEPLPEKASPRPKVKHGKASTNPPGGPTNPQRQPDIKPPSDALPSAPPKETSPPALEVAPAQAEDADPQMVPNPPPPQQLTPAKPTQPSLVETQTDGKPLAPPVPKPRTLQVVVSPSHGLEPVQVSLISKDREACSTDPTSDSNEEGKAHDGAGPMAVPLPVSSVTVPPAAHTLVRLCVEKTHDDDDADSMNVMCTRSLRDKDESSTASDEFYECNDSDGNSMHPRLTNGGEATGGSGRVRGHASRPDLVNVMARFSQSMVDLRPETHTEPDTAERNFLNTQNRFTGKFYQPVSRSSAQEVYNRPKVVIAKPGVFHRPPKSSAHVIGGHKYWQAKFYTSARQPNTAAPPSASHASRSPRRRGSPYRSGELKSGRSLVQCVEHVHPLAPAHRTLTHTHSLSPQRRNEMQTPMGIPISKLASYRNMMGKAPGVMRGVGMGDKKVMRGQKES